VDPLVSFLFLFADPKCRLSLKNVEWHLNSPTDIFNFGSKKFSIKSQSKRDISTFILTMRTLEVNIKSKWTLLDNVSQQPNYNLLYSFTIQTITNGFRSQSSPTHKTSWLHMQPTGNGAQSERNWSILKPGYSAW